MQSIQQWLPFLIPIIVLQLALMIFALIDLARRERTRGPNIRLDQHLKNCITGIR